MNPLLPALLGLMVAGAETELVITRLKSLDVLRKAFVEGDLVTVARGRALLQSDGEDIGTGSVALLDDLSRLVRCQPIGPIPSREERSQRALRRAVRLERIRLERLLRDEVHNKTPLAQLLLEPRLYQAKSANEDDVLVRWPIESDGELWPEEWVEGRLDADRCPTRPGQNKELEIRAHQRNKALRAEREREALTELVTDLEILPNVLAGRIAFAYLSYARTQSFLAPEEWSEDLERALDRGEAGLQGQGLFMLARNAELQGEEVRARDLYRRVLNSPITPDEDSRVRVRLVAREEPEWDRVLEVARGARAARPFDLSALELAEARALYATVRYDELMTFGRRWLTLVRPADAFTEALEDLLLKLSLNLDPVAALAWVEEMAVKGNREKRARSLERLGNFAREAGRLDLARAVYDRLRIEAEADRATRGPSAVVEEIRWIAERARIEFADGDVERFASLLDALKDRAKSESDRPLARLAPHRETARLVQDLLGRLVEQGPGSADAQKFAALLLELVVPLSETPTRWQQTLSAAVSPLTRIAGRFAAGRTAQPAARISDRPRKKPVRYLGEVTVPRLPPILTAPDIETPAAVVDTFLAFEQPGGTVTVGAPWMDRAWRRNQKAK